MIQPFILATAGHVDHGKSALVKALTGTDPDRLPEEKARGITIDLGFAHLELPSPSPVATTFSCGIVDVPGHEDFVKNMVAGVGAIDLALLVVAADDGWMPQTEEHLQILQYLGVRRAVVALTKIDLVTDESAAVDALRTRIAGTDFEDAPIVPTSIPCRRGLDDLRHALARVLANTPPPPDYGKPRLAIDRVFVLKGIGTVVTGTLAGGALTRGDAAVLQPSGRRVRIRSCQSHGHDVEQVVPGTRTALNLSDIGADDIHRGDVVTRDSLGCPSVTLDVLVGKSSRLADSPNPAARPIKAGAPLRLHLGCANVPARVHFLRGTTLAPGSSVLAQLRLDAPVLAFAGDHFLLRDAAEQRTLAGGIILDPGAPRNHVRNEDRLAHLDACASNPGFPDPLIEAQLQQRGLARLETLLVQSRFPAREIIAAVGRTVARGRAILAGTSLASATFWSDRLATATRAIDRHHETHPERAGLSLAELRAALEHEHGEALGFDELVAQLARNEFVVRAATIRRSTHLPALPPALHAPGQRLRDLLARQPLEPPSRRELAPDAPSQQALRFLIQSGEAVDLGSEVVIAGDAFHHAGRRIAAHLKRHGRATASELRLLLSTSRRVLIPLLERLDREGLTIRDGDVRRLASTATGPPAPAPENCAGGAHPTPRPDPRDSKPAGDAHPEGPATHISSEC